MPTIARILIICVSLLGGMEGWSQPCECESPADPGSAFEQADIVFSGKVIHVNTNWMSGGMKFTFEVRQYWKQRVNQYYVVNSGWEEQDCGYTFEEGQTYLVFVKRKFTPKTDRCSGNKLLGAARNDLDILGPGKPPAAAPGLARMNWTLAIIGVVSILFVAFIVLRKKIAPTS